MKQINTLQSIRFFAFMMIFLLHTQTYHFTKFIYSAPCAVSFFIMLSGFLYGYKYCNYQKNINLKEIINFALKKIKGFYPLHLIMLIILIPLSGIFTLVNINDINEIMIFVKKFVINVLLLQSYTTTDYFYFNGVSWYLSSTVFLIVITLPLIKIISKIGNSSKGIIKLSICMLFILIIDFIYILYIKNNSYSLEYWLYVFPPSRITEYVFGIITGFIIGKKGESLSKKFNTLIFTLLELFITLSLIFIIKNVYIDEWLWRTIIWIIPNTFLIAIFSFEKGILSKLISNKLFIYLGSITFELFLIHGVIISYFLRIIGDNLTNIAKFSVLFYIFTLTIIFSVFAHSIRKNFSSSSARRTLSSNIHE